LESVSIERDIRGIPLWLLQIYLVDLGGEVVRLGEVLGNGWAARLTQLEDFRIGSIAVGQVRLEIKGSPETMADLKPQLEKKLLRAGG
jgi:hypothetical protein